MPFEQHDKELEHWLRDHAERHRLFPEESTWEGIQRKLNRRRWFPLVFSLLLITGGAVSWVMITNPADPSARYASGPMASLQQQHTKTTTATTQDSHEQSPPFKIAAQPSSERPADWAFIRWTSNEDPSIVDQEADATNHLSLNNQEEHTVPELYKESTAKTTVKPQPVTPTEKLVSETADPAHIDVPGETELNKTTPSTADPSAIKQPDATPTGITPEQIQTIESVVNTYKGKRTKKSWQVQFSISPTVSYRKLIEDTEALQAARSAMSAAPVMAVPEFESVVKHKPDLGMQIGVSVNRQLTDRVAFVGGLQFNVNKYDIKAYPGTREVATVGLSNGGNAGSVSSYTYYRSSGGTWANWLANFYFTASAPVGFQVKLAGNKKWNWGVGSTLQPTYILSKQVYLLSADYKNYLEMPSLVRRWNLNGQVETFIGFEGKKMRYTLGPQARYQILSSFEKSYPVQEHLFDIGIKLGIGL